MRSLCTFLELLATTPDPGTLRHPLHRLLSEATPEELPHLIALLSGHPPARSYTTRTLREVMAQSSDLPDWLLTRCREELADLPECLARCWPREGPGLDQSLNQLLTNTLSKLEEPATLPALWDRCTTPERILVNRLLLARFPKALPRPLLAEVLGSILGNDPAWLEIQLASTPRPTTQDLTRWSNMPDTNLHQPYPYPTPKALVADTELSPLSDWQTEWIWPGVPAQLIVRDHQVQIWTEAGLVTDRFPSVISEATNLLNGSVLEGQLMTPPGSPPLREEKVATCDPDLVLFMARDCLEVQGVDIRSMPLYSRREQLLPMVGSLDLPHFRASEPLFPDHPQDLHILQENCRSRGAVGLLFKPIHGAYDQGYRSWRVPRLQQTLHLLYVLVAGEPEYTFGLQEENEWIPMARLRLKPEQQALAEKIDTYIQSHTVEKKGPIRLVEPCLQALISYDAEIPSPRHKSGVEWIGSRVDGILPLTD